MSATKWAAPNSATGVNAMTTELNSLANGSYAISSAVTSGPVTSGVYDNTANLDLFADFSVSLAYTTTAPSAGTKVAELYLLPSIDGTNFASVDGSNVPQKALLIATFECRNPSTSTLETLLAPGISLPPRKFKLVLKNTSGQTLKATTNVVTVGPYQIQNV